MCRGWVIQGPACHIHCLLPCHKRILSCKARLALHDPMLTLNNDYAVSEVFFNNSQNDLCNFTRNRSEADRPIITKFFFLALLEDWNKVYQLPDKGDLSRFVRLLKNNWERPTSSVSWSESHPAPQTCVHSMTPANIVQVQSQLGPYCYPVMVPPTRSAGVPEPIICVKDRGKRH